ncbi:MAG: glycosyltransferase family 4 protein [Firmicutes bacterium]|nr:glycosyltransferase family 4 protein [Bacillota bacterium]
MNVLHLNRFFYSGQTTHAFSLVREQQKQGINARLVMDGNPSYQALDLYKRTMDEMGAAIIKPGDLQALLRHLHSWRPHVIHAHSALTFPLAMSLVKKYHVPLIITCHGLGLNHHEARPYLQEAKAIICISTRVANTFREFATKVHTIPNGVDLHEFMPQKKDEPIKVALVGRIDTSKQKGYNHFCKAVDLLDGVEFYVAANKSPNSKTAHYLGWTNEVASLLAQTDIVAGTGRAIIEGLACGNAVIILGRTCQGILTPEKVAKQKWLDISGLSGSDPCYKNMFYDLAKLTQNKIYLQQLQTFGRDLAIKEFDNSILTKKIIDIYKVTSAHH